MHRNKSETADFQWLSHKDETPMGSLASWCIGCTDVLGSHTPKSTSLKEIFTLLLQCHFTVFPWLPLRLYLYYSFLKLLIFWSFQGSCPVLVEAHTCIYWDFKCCSPCIWVEKRRQTWCSPTKEETAFIFLSFLTICRFFICQFWGIYYAHMIFFFPPHSGV